MCWLVQKVGTASAAEIVDRKSARDCSFLCVVLHLCSKIDLVTAEIGDEHWGYLVRLIPSLPFILREHREPPNLLLTEQSCDSQRGLKDQFLQGGHEFASVTGMAEDLPGNVACLCNDPSCQKFNFYVANPRPLWR